MRLLSFLVLCAGTTAFVASAIAPAYAGDCDGQTVTPPSVQQTLGIDPHHTDDAGGSEGSGTHLYDHESVVIQAPDETGQNICRSVINQSATQYYIPWNSPREWSAFLNTVAGGSLPSVTASNYCCTPDASEVVCGVEIGDLGSRWLGLPYQTSGVVNDTPYYASQNDVYGPIYASTLLPLRDPA
jgi:hypothetical protein